MFEQIKKTLGRIKTDAEKRERKKKFVHNLKHGKPRGRTRPPVRLVARVPRQFDGGGLND
jgi:hypothetical protein